MVGATKAAEEDVEEEVADNEEEDTGNEIDDTDADVEEEQEDWLGGALSTTGTPSL